MENESCPECRPDGLKISTVNGVTQVEVPNDFASDQLGSMDQQVAQAMAFAQQIGLGERPGMQSSRAGIVPSNESFASGLHLDAPQHVPVEQFTPPAQPQPTRPTPGTDQFTLAETDAADVFGLWAPKGPATTDQFTLPETDAADVFGLLQGGEDAETKRLRKLAGKIQDILDGLPDGLTDEQRQRIEDFLRTTLGAGPHHHPLHRLSFKTLTPYDSKVDGGLLGDESCNGLLERSVRYGVIINIALGEQYVGQYREYLPPPPKSGTSASAEQAIHFSKGEEIQKDAAEQLAKFKKDNPIDFDGAELLSAIKAMLSEIGLPTAYLRDLVEDGFAGDPGIDVTCPPNCDRVVTILDAKVEERPTGMTVTHKTRSERWGLFKDAHGNSYRIVYVYVGLCISLAYDIIINFRVECVAKT